MLCIGLLTNCVNNSSDDLKVGNCERGEDYIEEYYGFITIEDTNVTLFKKTYNYKLRWLGKDRTPQDEFNDPFFVDDIMGAEFKLSLQDTFYVKALEYGHDEGACGPQQDSISFIFHPPEFSKSTTFKDSVLIGTWKSDWYKGDRVELLSYNDYLIIRRNIYADGSFYDHPLWKVDSSGSMSYVDLSEESMIYYRILKNGDLGVFSKYIHVKTLERK